MRNIDTIQVITNFEIGRRILEHEQQGEERAEYGNALVKDLSKKLSKEFGRGFSERNLEYMRKFYLLYQNRFGKISQIASAKSVDQGKSQTVSGELKKTQTASAKLQTSVFPLSWSQYVFLLGVKDDDSRSFYEIESANNRWTLPELTRQFNSGLYERLVLSRDKKGIKKLSQKGKIIEKPEDLLKEPYVLEFLGWMKVQSIPNLIWKQLLSISLSIFFWSLAKAFCLKLGKNVLRLMKITFLLILFFIIDCLNVTCLLI